MLIPYLLTLPKSYLTGARLRVFSVANTREKLESEQERFDTSYFNRKHFLNVMYSYFRMAALLQKFRINYKEVFVIPDLSSKPEQKSLKEFNELIKPYIRNDEAQMDKECVYTSDAELVNCRDKVERYFAILVISKGRSERPCYTC